MTDPARVLNAAGAESTWWDFGRAALVGGVTTVTDLGVDILGQPDLRRLMGGIVNDSAFPARVVTYALPAAHGQAWDPAQVADAFHALRSQQTDRWRLGGIKLVADGSIQGWTVVLNPPGYRDGSPGIWMVSPEEMLRSVPVFHAAGIKNRRTASGRVLGPEERISAYDALKAGTLDAAYQLHLDHQIGSLETGKLADVTVLAGNPLRVDPMAIREISVHATMVGGTVYETPGQR